MRRSRWRRHGWSSCSTTIRGSCSAPLDTPSQALLPTGLQRRPGLAEARHLVGEAVHPVNIEKLSAWLPNVLMGTSDAAFGGSQGSQIDNTAGRFDLDAITY